MFSRQGSWVRNSAALTSISTIHGTQPLCGSSLAPRGTGTLQCPWSPNRLSTFTDGELSCSVPLPHMEWRVWATTPQSYRGYVFSALWCYAWNSCVEINGVWAWQLSVDEHLPIYSHYPTYLPTVPRHGAAPCFILLRLCLLACARGQSNLASWRTGGKL